MKRNLIVVLGIWIATVVALTVIGFVYASTGLMGQLSRESEQTGRDPFEIAASDVRYAGLPGEGERQVKITKVFVFPLLSAALGTVAGIFGRRRTLWVSGLGLAPLAVFDLSAGGFTGDAIGWSLGYLSVGCVVAWFVNRGRAVENQN